MLETATEILIYVAVAALSVFAWFYYRERKTFAKLPPKWQSYPLIGNIGIMKSNPNDLSYLFFRVSSKIRQPLFSYRQFGKYFIAINDFATYKELLVEHGANTSGRIGFPSFSFVNKEIGERSGIFINEGPDLALFRRKMITLLHAFGFGQSDFELEIVEQTKRTCEKLVDDVFIDPQNRFIELSAGLISTISFNRMFSIEQPSFQRLIQNLNVLLEGGLMFPISMFLPYKWMAELPIFDKRYMEAYNAMLEVFDFLKEEIFDYCDKRDDFDRKNILSETLNFVSSKGKKFNNYEIRGIFFDLYLAGMETTASTLSWLSKLMAEFPEYQQKVYEEVSEVEGIISRNRVDEIPFTNAVIHETLRFASTVTMVIPHKVTEEFTSKSGHTYPKGSILMGNMWALTRDPKTWENPNIFNPGHFLKPDGTFRDRDEFIPFGAGPRNCVGKNLAKVEILIAFTTLMRNCKIEKPEGDVWDINDVITKATRRPKPFKVKLIARE